MPTKVIFYYIRLQFDPDTPGENAIWGLDYADGSGNYCQGSANDPEDAIDEAMIAKDDYGIEIVNEHDMLSNFDSCIRE